MIFKPTELLPFSTCSPAVQHGKGQEGHRSSQDCNYPIYLSLSLASSDTSGAGTKATSRSNPSEIPLFHHARGLGCWAAQELSSQPGSQPQARGMLEDKYIPFGKRDRERFDIIDSVHERCSSAWKGQCVTMQFQYSGCFGWFFFMLFFPLAVKTGKVLQIKVSS